MLAHQKKNSDLVRAKPFSGSLAGVTVSKFFPQSSFDSARPPYAPNAVGLGVPG
jgi:hypothetical protein